MGAAFYADEVLDLHEVAQRLDNYSATATYVSLPPLFADKQEYEEFHARHMKASVPCLPFGADCGPVHIGIDSGSTTIKAGGHRPKRQHPVRRATAPTWATPSRWSRKRC